MKGMIFMKIFGKKIEVKQVSADYKAWADETAERVGSVSLRLKGINPTVTAYQNGALARLHKVGAIARRVPLQADRRQLEAVRNEIDLVLAPIFAGIEALESIEATLLKAASKE